MKLSNVNIKYIPPFETFPTITARKCLNWRMSYKVSLNVLGFRTCFRTIWTHPNASFQWYGLQFQKKTYKQIGDIKWRFFYLNLQLKMISITIFLHVPHEVIFPCKCLFTSRARKCFTFCMTIDMSFHAIQRLICA